MALPTIPEFEVTEKLGAGSYATVYKARCKKHQCFHAIKCVEISRLSYSAKENLITEIRLLRSLEHKHIVALQDFFWDDKNIYIALEYCNAGNLSAFIRSKKALPEITCQYFLRQLAAAIQYLRSNDICHFDLKPQNLLLTRNGNVSLKVADFGFAQHLEMGETNAKLKGSPLYMAPEIVCRHRYDAKADLWSIGIILYECLFGKAPYTSKTIDELLERIRKVEPITLPPNANISSQCRDLLHRLLEHDPAKRISFEEFFAHPFICLDTFPSEQTLKKAIKLVNDAIEQDEQHNYNQAFQLYCRSLKYFVPLIMEETDAAKRLALRTSALGYLKRAEELKTCQRQPNAANCTESGAEELPGNSSSTAAVQPTQRTIAEVLEPDMRYKQLYALSHSSPSLKSGLEIGRQGELYQHERKLESALDAYVSALGILVPFVKNEPNGERKSLLVNQLDIWMKDAECIKDFLNAKKIDDIEQKISSVRSCTIQ